MKQNTNPIALTPDEWGTLGGFVLLLLGLNLLNHELAVTIGFGAIVIIVIKGYFT